MPIPIKTNLTAASAAAATSLNVQQAQLSVKQHNIENLNNTEYTALESIIREVGHNNTLSGVELASIVRRFDQMKASIMYNTASDVSRLDMLVQYYQKIQDSLIKPDDNKSILASLDSLIASINDAAQNATTYNRDLMHEKLTDFSKAVGGTYHTLTDQQKAIDLDMTRMVDEANNLMQDLHNLGINLLAQHKGTAQYAVTQNSIHSKLVSLAKYFKIEHFYDKNSVLNVHALNGGYKLVGSSVYKLNYTGGGKLGSENSHGTLELLAYGYGDKVADRYKIALKTDDNMKGSFDGGAIPGLLLMRDQKIPSILDAIDRLAFDIAKSFNAIHNLGSTTEESALHGSHNTTPNTTFAASGSFVVAPLNSSGDPIFSDQFGYLPSSKINLSEISINNSPNNSSISPVVNSQSIIDEINRLANKTSRVSAMGFFDIQLASMSKNFAPGSDIVLDFDLTSDGLATKSSISILNVKAQDSNGIDITANLTNGGTLFDVSSGDRVRTGINGGPKILLPNLPNNLSYPIYIKTAANIQTDSLSVPITLEFVIDAPSSYDNTNINGALNKRFYASSATTDDIISKSQVKILQNSKPQIIKAKLVDQQGNIQAGSNAQSRMVIEMSDKSQRIAIGSGTSDLRNLDGNIDREFGGISNIFGLNDLFTHQDAENLGKNYQAPHYNATKNFMLRSAIQNNKKIFSLGKISPYQNALSGIRGSGLYYNLGANNFELVGNYQNVNLASSPNQTISLHDQIVNIMSETNLNTKALMTKQESARNLFQGAKEVFESVSSVNLNQEMVDVSLIQVAYNANARALKALQGLTEILLNTVAG